MGQSALRPEHLPEDAGLCGSRCDQLGEPEGMEPDTPLHWASQIQESEEKGLTLHQDASGLQWRFVPQQSRERRKTVEEVLGEGQAGPWALENIAQYMPQAEPITPATGSTNTQGPLRNSRCWEPCQADLSEPAPPSTPGCFSMSSTIDLSTPAAKCSVTGGPLIAENGAVDAAANHMGPQISSLLARLRNAARLGKTDSNRKECNSSSGVETRIAEYSVADEHPHVHLHSEAQARISIDALHSAVGEAIAADRREKAGTSPTRWRPARLEIKRPPGLDIQLLDSPSLLSSMTSLPSPDVDVLLESPCKASHPQLLTHLWADIEEGFEAEMSDGSTDDYPIATPLRVLSNNTDQAFVAPRTASRASSTLYGSGLHI
mmetsp:Transcript_25350/g.58939  ORF Transcript_25350/g.58939 Transcript_25350/m.58939 type:complete len:376 (+) Transcript_25350:100-1227(+)|eukprot:CAMPEP_0178396732 /NCGR_PEP_ID=MMETSP0689_2-20121128/13878_1 /TAXON_ID=160604 /ORGANISM="Amphidinium massartii, Strain CS-259" /LENGTH=375 /DNA_ID=CAMNT_0020017411 /DNA_START=50 /DNA_END=1177 /DNA_ORIENTATION=+